MILAAHLIWRIRGVTESFSNYTEAMPVCSHCFDSVTNHVYCIALILR
jgi:hypothetical protein